MPTRFSSEDSGDLIQAERDVQARIGDMEIDFDALSAISNIFRVANTARYHMERTVLAKHDLSFTAFTVLWVLWVWGEREARDLAAEAGISKGTLTGVVSTLQRRGLVIRRTHPNDKRLVLIESSDQGQRIMEKLFPAFNGEEIKMTSTLTVAQKQDLATSLRSILRLLEGDSA